MDFSRECRNEFSRCAGLPDLLLRHLENEFGEFYKDTLCDGVIAARWCATTDFFRRHRHNQEQKPQQYADFERNSGVFMSVYLRLHVVACPAPIKAYFNRKECCIRIERQPWGGSTILCICNERSACPKDIVMKRSRELDASLIISEENGGVRRELVRKIGLDRVLKELNAKVLMPGDHINCLSWMSPACLLGRAISRCSIRQ